MPKKNPKIEQVKDENADKRKNYRPSITQQQLLVDLSALFDQDDRVRDNDMRRYFNEDTLDQYLDDNQKRINGYTEPRDLDDPNDWQTRYRNLLTRNKFLAILAKMATLRMEMAFKDKQGVGDVKKLRIFNALYNHYKDLDNGDMKQFMSMWNAWQDGTVVEWVKPEQKTKKIKSIKSYNEETGETKTVKKILKKWKVKSNLLPLQDVWFGNIREPNVQEQPHLWMRFTPTYQEFIADWGEMNNSEYVMPTTGTNEDHDDLFYDSNNTEQDRVEIIWYQNVWEDRMVIYGSKVELYDGPIPYEDKKEGKFYPLAVGVNEPFAADIIYGKSGADKLRGDQDLIDMFYRKFADRTILQTDPPIMEERGSNPDLPERIRLKPGDRVPVDNIQGIKEFAFSNTTNELINAIGLFTDSADLTSSTSQAGQGVAQSNRTATADLIAEKSQRQLLGLSQFFMENFMKQDAMLVARHILQGINNPESIEASMGEDGKVKDVKLDFGTFTERNVQIEEGVRGDIVYKIVKDDGELKSSDALDILEIRAKQQGKNVKFVELTPDYFDDFLIDVEPVVGSSLEESPALKRQLETQFQQGFANFFPEIFQQNQTEFAKDYIEAFEKEVDVLLGSGETPNPQAMQQLQQLSQQAGQGGAPKAPQGATPPTQPVEAGSNQRISQA